MLWNAISYVLRGQFCLKCSLNQLSVSCLFMFVFANNGAGYQFQFQYTLFLYKYRKNSYEISEMSKSGFFLSRSHIGWDSGFSSKAGRISTWSGWLDSLITWYTTVPLICYFKCEHNAIFLSHRLISVATCVIGCFDVFTLCDWLKKYVPGFRPIRRR